MLRRLFLSVMLGVFFILSGFYSCGGNTTTIIEITANSDSLHPGEELQLTVEIREGDGNIVGSFTFSSSQGRYATVDNTGLVKALYPGVVEIIAMADGLVSDPFILTVEPPENSQTIRQVTDNTLGDMWGDPSNFWKTTARRMILWQRVLAGGDHEVILYDNDADMEMTLENHGLNDIDFMALGSGASDNTVMASYRVNNTDTFVSDDGAAPVNLGDNNQEQNSIDSGCFFFREGAGIENILRYTFADGFLVVDTTPADNVGQPISSACQALWEREVGGLRSLQYFDGLTITEIDSGLPVSIQYDFALGRIVYAKNNDIFLVDTTTNPFTETQITNDGMTIVDIEPRTDGNSIVWWQFDPVSMANHIILYDIQTGTQEIISTNTDLKDSPSLQIALKQVIWTEPVGKLFFHDGSGTASGTIQVPLVVPLDGFFDPYISDGLVTWIGNDGDTEVFVLE